MNNHEAEKERAYKNNGKLYNLKMFVNSVL